MLIRLKEASPPVDISMPSDVALWLSQNRVATVAPSSASGMWRVSGVQRIGVLQIGGHEIRIVPKIPISRLFFLLGYANGSRKIWHDTDVTFDRDDDLLSAVARAYIQQLKSALSRGLLQGYRTLFTAENTVRGKIDFNEQLKRRAGIPAPIELIRDEFTVDTDENRILRTACEVLLRLPLLDVTSRRMLRFYLSRFDGVQGLIRGTRPPAVAFDRRNDRYRAAIGLAELILTGGSLEHREGNTHAVGFLINGAEIFEDFVGMVLRENFESMGGQVATQLRSSLDRDLRLAIRPDVAWMDGDRVLAIMDAKYKAEKPAGYPHADVYQMIAYCTRYELSAGHLIYASGNEIPKRHAITNSSMTIHCHAIELDASPDEILMDLREICRDVAALSARERPSVAVNGLLAPTA